MECEKVKTQTKTRLRDIADVCPHTVSELLNATEGKKRFSSFYEERASELAEYRADLANKCLLMERRLNEEMTCMFQSSHQMSSDEEQVSQEYRMLDDEAARYLLAARQIILLMDGYIQKTSHDIANAKCVPERVCECTRAGDRYQPISAMATRTRKRK